jgi:hypothetical protein
MQLVVEGSLPGGKNQDARQGGDDDVMKDPGI